MQGESGMYSNFSKPNFFLKIFLLDHDNGSSLKSFQPKNTSEPHFHEELQENPELNYLYFSSYNSNSGKENENSEEQP